MAAPVKELTQNIVRRYILIRTRKRRHSVIAMIEESTGNNTESPKDDEFSVPEVVADLLADTAIPGIPAPVRRNFLKAIGQLSSAAVDIPVAYLTGKADERRAETEARVKLIRRSAEQIAEQMRTDPAYARVAVHKFGHRVLREQVNLDLISQRAIGEIRNNDHHSDHAGPGESSATIDDDWLNAFETEARQKSTEQMQAFFGKMLAGEIKKPGSFSTRTVRILSNLDQNIAIHFARICSMSISQFRDTRVPSLNGNTEGNALKDYGLDFDALNLLNEHGLIISDYNSWREYRPCIAVPTEGHQAICIPLNFQGKSWILLPKSKNIMGRTFKVNGVALTLSGRELFKIVEVELMDNYAQALTLFFNKKGYRMIEVSDNKPLVDVNAGTMLIS